MTATLDMDFENSMGPLRTPLKTPTSSRLNLKTPGRTLGGTPIKGGLCATPRSVRALNNITNRSLAFVTPGFKKPTTRLSPSLRFSLKTKTPKYSLAKDGPGSKFSVHFDEDSLLREMEEKNFVIEEKESCPWGVKETEVSKRKTAVELDEQISLDEPKLPSLSPMQLNLDNINDSTLDSTLNLSDFNLSNLSIRTPVKPCSDPVLEQMEKEGFEVEEKEACPWGNKIQEEERRPLSPLQLEEFIFEEKTLDAVSFLSLGSPVTELPFLDISELSDLPELPSSPSLDSSLSELLDLAF